MSFCASFLSFRFKSAPKTKNKPDDDDSTLRGTSQPKGQASVGHHDSTILTDPPSSPLIRISLAKLIAEERPELERLLTASRELGAFYLDLQDTELGRDILENAEKLFPLGVDVFELPDREKEKYEMGKFGGYYGYKGYLNRTLDRKEFYTISKDDFMPGICPPSSRQTVIPQPSPILSARPLIQSYIEHAHAISTIILRQLYTVLCLPVGTLENIHRCTASSGDQVRWIKIQPSSEPRISPLDDILLDEHCDSNSITLLFNRLGGLQIRAKNPCGETEIPQTSSCSARKTKSEGATALWLPADPVPGHCIVNLGEQIAKLSHRVLRACVHRVCMLPGTDSTLARYTLVYFARPENEIILQQLGGATVVPRPGILATGADNERTRIELAALRMRRFFDDKKI